MQHRKERRRQWTPARPAPLQPPPPSRPDFPSLSPRSRAGPRPTRLLYGSKGFWDGSRASSSSCGVRAKEQRSAFKGKTHTVRVCMCMRVCVLINSIGKRLCSHSPNTEASRVRELSSLTAPPLPPPLPPVLRRDVPLQQEGSLGVTPKLLDPLPTAVTCLPSVASGRPASASLILDKSISSACL